MSFSHTYKTIITILVTISFISCSKKFNEVMEKEAITHVIKEYVLAQKTFDSEKLLHQWAHKPYAMRIAGNHVTVSWDSIKTYFSAWDQYKSDPENYRIDKLDPINFNIEINGNFAVAIYDTEGKSHWEGVDR